MCINSSLIGRIPLGHCVRIVQPVHVVHKLVSLRTETDWLDVEIIEAQVLWVHNQVLRLNSHELRVQPCAEPLAVEGLVPLHVVVVVGVLQGHSRHIRFDLTDIKEHLVNLLVSVRVRPAQIVALSNRFLHLQAVKDGQSDVIGKDRLDISIHSLNLPKQSVEHLHVHAPLGCNRHVRVKALHHVGRSQDSHIRADRFNLLLTDPLGAKTPALRVRISTCCRHIHEALDLR